jgi:multiple sugar transport system ATP-binding protein
LYDKPVNVFVAAFIGSPSMNLYEASIDGTTLRLGSQTLTLHDTTLERRPGLRAYDGTKVIVGIRPEDFEDATLAESTSPDRRVTAPVTLTEALGSEIMVHFELDAPTVDSGDPDAVEESGADAVGRFNPRSRVRPGEIIEIAVTTENLQFFDPDTRLTIPEGA